MDHSSHSMGMDHDMPMPDMCKMNVCILVLFLSLQIVPANLQMLFTWEWENTCVVYKWWHVKTFQGFVGTLVAIAALSLLYEFSRAWVNTWRIKNTPPVGSAPSSLSRAYKVKLSVFYAFQVGFSFMLMLVFMTYNGWYMLAVVAGAGIGHYLWGSETESRSMSCH
ncbi:CIC11C00000000056 [Sungouiella intermedia]|uniref:Copper transport protein n=2 Tax=Sungouiella intermedia TaxID=45354 RepID=A0A1L0G5I0_9ASCO|nr:CIC11C00000000056 [[Candida] intermedia]